MGPRLSSLFLHSPVGHAHLVASRALAAALTPAWHREELDYLAFMPALERRLWTGVYHLALAHAPGLWRAWRRWTDRPGEPRVVRDRVGDAGACAFARVLEAVRPQLVVSTIGGAATLAGAARTRLGTQFLNALVVTHFRGHRHWARQEADLVFVANDEVRADLVRHGLPDGRVLRAGDIVGIDIGLKYQGWCGDSCVTYAVGTPAPEAAVAPAIPAEALKFEFKPWGGALS